MKDLESILHEYFHCNKPFLKTPKKSGTYFDGTPTYDYLTSSGSRAYLSLVGLLYDLGDLGVFGSDDVILAIDKLDEIVSLTE